MKHLGGGAVLQQLARIHHGGVAAQQQRLTRFGGGVNHGGVTAGKQCAKFFTQLFAQFVIQIHQRLVQQHQGGSLGQGAGQGHALLLTAGQLGGVTV